MTPETVLGNGQRAVPCFCGWELCEGWVLLNALPGEPAAPEPVVDVAGKELLPWCGHGCEVGGEGPIEELGRWPVLWECVTCGNLSHEVYG
jgi:hypothetical protein